MQKTARAMPMLKFKVSFGILAIGLMMASTQASAGAYQEENIKMHCAILKNGKPIKQLNCVADGFVHAGAMYGGGSGYEFKPIKGYGAIDVATGVNVVQDANGDPVWTDEGEVLFDEGYTLMNGKDAVMRYRMPKTFRLLSEKEEEQYLEGKLKIQPYTCFGYVHLRAFEFCFSKPLMG